MESYMKMVKLKEDGSNFYTKILKKLVKFKMYNSHCGTGHCY